MLTHKNIPEYNTLLAGMMTCKIVEVNTDATNKIRSLTANIRTRSVGPGQDVRLSVISSGTYGLVMKGDDGNIYKLQYVGAYKKSVTSQLRYTMDLLNRTNPGLYAAVKAMNGLTYQKTMTDIYLNIEIHKVFQEYFVQKLLYMFGYTNHEGQTVKLVPNVQNLLYCTTYPDLTVGDVRYVESTTILSNPVKSGETFRFFLIQMEPMTMSLGDSILLQPRRGVNSNMFWNIMHDFIAIGKVLNSGGWRMNHCDIKDNNLMYDSAGNLRYIDFGYTSMTFPIQTSFGLRRMTLNGECGTWPERYYVGRDLMQMLIFFGLYERDSYRKQFSRSVETYIVQKLMDAGIIDVIENFTPEFASLGITTEWHIGYNYDERLLGPNGEHGLYGTNVEVFDPDLVLGELSLLGSK
jgi:serine/threonine protein kinase